jgi:outer membrane lipoprotein LolB
MPSALFRWLRLWSLSAAMFYLAGCAIGQQHVQQQTSPLDPALYRQHLASLADIEHFELRGRIGVQNDGRGFSGSTQWQHFNTGDHIALFSPLGGQVATIKTTANGVELIDSDGKIYRAQDAETLTQQNLGWSLPMQGLSDWVLGRPSDSESVNTDNAIWDESGKLSRLKQHGWEIEYQEYREASGRQLPARLTLRSPKLYLKLVIQEWDIPPAGTPLAKQQ